MSIPNQSPPNQKESLLQGTIFFLVCSIPVSIGTLNPLAEITITVSLLLSTLLLVLYRRVSINDLQPLTRNTAILLMLYFGVGALTYFTHQPTDSTLTRIGSTLHFVLIIPIIIAIVNCKIDKKWLYFAIIGGAILSGSHALYQTFEIGMRATGTINAVIFGGTSMLLGFMSLASWQRLSEMNYGYFWPIIGFLFGIAGSLLSLSRGSWIITPALIICTIIYAHYNTHVSRKDTLPAAIGGFAVLAILIWWLWPYFGPRINVAVDQWNQYFAGESYFNSIGLRLEIWKAAFFTIQDNPLLGAGMGGRQEAFAGLLADGRVRDISYLYHVHNQVLQDGADKGLLGIASYLALMGYLIHYFYKGVKQKLKNSDIHFVGLLLVVGYLFLGITNVTFNHGVWNTFFVAMLALIFCFTENQEK